jgi:tetratricopeptide (TPR) repeat protein
MRSLSTLVALTALGLLLALPSPARLAAQDLPPIPGTELPPVPGTEVPAPTSEPAPPRGDTAPPGSQTPASGGSDEGPPTSPHMPPPPAAPKGDVAATTSADKGPNLQLPDGLTEAGKKQLEEAIAAWDKAYASLQRGRPDAKTQAEAAIVKLNAARAVDGKSPLCDYYLGIAYQLTAQPELAIARLRDAVRKNPKFHEAFVELGDAFFYHSQNKLADAEKAYDDAVRVGPEYAHGYKMRAAFRMTRERFADALADYRRALQLKPGDVETLMAIQQLALAVEGPRWTQAFETESKNYIIKTNVSQEFSDEVSKHAELIRRLYESIFPKPGKKKKSVIIVFASKKEYHQNGGPQGAGGHFNPLFKQLYLFKYAKDSDTKLVLYHEGFHQFLDALEVEAPQWFNEGMADFFGPSQYVNEKGTEGMRIQPSPWRIDLIKQAIRGGQTIPFQRLMTMTQAEMYDPKVVSVAYAQAWSMCYFFAQADDRAHFEYLKDYFQALRKGKTLKQAYESVFGKADMAAMEERWRTYILGVQ